MNRHKKRMRIAAIRPNAGLRDWYRARINEVLRACRNDVLSVVKGSHPTYGLNIAMDEELADSITAQVDQLFARWIDRISDLGRQIATEFVSRTSSNYNRSLSSKLRKAGFTVPMQNTESTTRAMRAAVGENVGLIKSIPQEYLADVNKYVWSAVEGGFDLSTLTDNLEHAYHIGRNRAKLIARDQSNKVNAVMEREKRLELGITEAVWRHSGAAKEPRQSHVKANGKSFDVSKGMYIDGKWILPGQEINCGCISESVVEI